MKAGWFTSRKTRIRNPIVTRQLELELLEARVVPTKVPNFSLPDLHPSTPTHGQNISPSTFFGDASGYYFANPG